MRTAGPVGRSAGALAIVAVLATGLVGSSVAAAPVLSDACASLNDPALDSRYADSLQQIGGFVTGLAVGEEVVVAATGNPDATMILGTTLDFALEIDTSRPFEIAHLVGADGTFAWTSGRVVIFPTLEPVEADWTVRCGLPEPVIISPYGRIVTEPPAGASLTVQVPVRMFGGSSTAEISVDFRTVDERPAPEASDGEDFVSTSGTVTFAPGQTLAFAEIEVIGDGVAEAPLYGGEWLVIEFDEPVGNAVLDTDLFFGNGLVIIFDADA